jgi:hypothetical protein
LRNLEGDSKNKNTEAQRAQRRRETRSKLRVLSASVFQRDPEEPGRGFEELKHRGTEGTKKKGDSIKAPCPQCLCVSKRS